MSDSQWETTYNYRITDDEDDCVGFKCWNVEMQFSFKEPSQRLEFTNSDICNAIKFKVKTLTANL